MVRRTSLIISEILAGLLAGLVALGGLAAYKLHSGPVSLDFMTPHLEQALRDSEAGFEVEIDRTVLVWAGWRQAIDIRATNVEVTGKDGVTLARVPELSVGLSLRALGRGNLAPTSLDALAPVIRVIRRETGEFALGVSGLVGEGGSSAEETPREQEDAARFLEFLVGELLDDPDPQRPLSYLRRVSVIDANLIFEDRLAGSYYRAPDAEIIAIRRPDGIDADVSMTLIYGDNRARISTNVSLERADRSYRSDFEFQGIEPADFAASIPQLAPLTALKMPLAGSFTIEGKMGLAIDSVRFDLVGGHGALELTDFYREALDVGGLRLKGVTKGDFRHVSIDQAVIDLEGPIIYASAQLTPDNEDTAIVISARAENLPMAELRRYWPPSLAAGQRRWVTGHIEEGIATRATIEITARMRGGDPNAIVLESVGGVLAYANLSVDYFAGLPPFYAITGEGTFDADGLYLGVGSAAIFEKMQVTRGQVDITGLTGLKDKIPARIDIDIDVHGPVRTMMEILDHEPLSYGKKLGFEPEKLGGDLTGNINFEFPLFFGLTTDMLDIRAAADLEGAAVADGPFDLEITDGKLALAVTQKESDVKGEVRLNGVPANIEWRENFADKSKFSGQFKVRARVGDKQRLALGLPDLSYWLKGPGDAEFIYTVREKKADRITVRANLVEAFVEIPEIDWRKRPGLKGSLSINGTVSKKGRLVFDSLRLKTADMDSDVRIEFLPDLSDIRLLKIKKAHFRGSDMTGAVTRMKNGGYDIDVRGKRIDARYWLDSALMGSGGGDEAGKGRPVRIKARFDEAITAENRFVYDALYIGRYDGWYWQSMSIQAKLAEGADFDLTFARSAAGKGYELDVKSSDAGQMLRALDWWDEIRGGSLVIRARQETPVAPLKGKFRVLEFEMAEAPGGLKLLQVITIVGLPSAVAQKGVYFAGMEGTFSYENNRLKLGKVEAWGPVGVIVDKDGWMDFVKGTLGMKGVVIPANTLQGILEKIPFLGLLFDEGLIAVNFTVSGKLENPKMDSSAISALPAPSFLRKLFRAPGGMSEDPEESQKGSSPRAE